MIIILWPFDKLKARKLTDVRVAYSMKCRMEIIIQIIGFYLGFNC